MHLKTDTTSAQSHYAQVPTISHSRNAFSVSERHLTTAQFDYLYPIYVKNMYPGDTLSVQQAVMARLQTQIQVLYDDLYFDLHAWFVPLRLIQTNWARFQFNAQPSGPSQDNSALTTPNVDLTTLGAGGFTSKSLYDYFGYPTKINLTGNVQWINNYWARAYNFIWNNDYRDENLQNPVVVDLDEGPDLASDYVLLKRGLRHDRFSSCLTATQKGASITLPIAGSAEVWGSRSAAATTYKQNEAPIIAYENSLYGATGLNAGVSFQGVNAAATGAAASHTGGTIGAQFSFANKALSVAFNATALPPFYADLSTATSATLNQFRQSFAIQHLLEADARGGTRDVESIQHRWGVTVPDFRLQRPEYLGGQTFTFDGHVVPQTSHTTGGYPQAGLTQFSQAQSSMKITHSFVEHGVFMVLLSMRSNLTYQEGLLRDLTYKTRYDFYQPEFANLGEVAVLNSEIYCQGTSADIQTFGFNEYAYELRYGMNRVSGEMRSNYATPLDSRHMAYDFASLPTLGSAFIQSATPISRNIFISAATADPVQLNTLVVGTCARTLPMYSIPGLKRM
nr:MAG: major capsid protein [Microvirus sp.]